MLLDDGARGGRIQFAIEGNDAAIRGGRVGAVGKRVGVPNAAAACGSAGIGMLHDDTTGTVELAHAFQRRVGVRDVVEGQFSSLNLLRLRDGCADGARVGVECGLLVRIFAVAQVKVLAKREIQVFRKCRGRAADGAGKVGGNHGVVLRCVRKRLRAQLAAHGQIGTALIGRQFVEQFPIIIGIHHHRDGVMIFCRGADHRGTADVDVVDRVLVGTVRAANGCREWVEIDRQ